ncbi:MAG: hypothetical protein AAF657_10045 [Acidobacteriota bacterium]
MLIGKPAVFIFILILIAVVAVTIVAQIATFETDTRYDVTVLVTQIEALISVVANKTIEQQTALNNWIVSTATDLIAVEAEITRLCDLADDTITPPPPTP